MKCLRCAFILAVVLLPLFSALDATAVDVDGNGLDDDLEQELAERFCPAFVLNSASIVKPEPVEILKAHS